MYLVFVLDKYSSRWPGRPGANVEFSLPYIPVAQQQSKGRAGRYLQVPSPRASAPWLSRGCVWTAKSRPCSSQSKPLPSSQSEYSSRLRYTETRITLRALSYNCQVSGAESRVECYVLNGKLSLALKSLIPWKGV